MFIHLANWSINSCFKFFKQSIKINPAVMKKMFVLFLICGGVIFFYAFSKPTLQAGNMHLTYTDSLKEERQKYIEQVLASVGDKRNTGADSVFQNIRTFRGKQGVPVKHFLAIMDYWGEALGVSCTYCHHTADWASDDINKKQIARDMFAMRIVINDDILSKIKNLESIPARVNCGTCHNGNPIPRE
jgi:hypothetical protein